MTRRMSLCFTFNFTQRGRYHWVYVGFFYPEPMLRPVSWALPSCFSLVVLVAGKGTLYADESSANSKKENVDTCSREGEWAEGSDCLQVLMVGRWAWCLDAPNMSL